jgi:hypothetical protein
MAEDGYSVLQVLKEEEWGKLLNCDLGSTQKRRGKTRESRRTKGIYCIELIER